MKFCLIYAYIQENAALCDEVASVQEQVRVYHKQRKSLLARLLKRNSGLEKQFLDWQKAKQGEKSTAVMNGDDTTDAKLGAMPQKRKYKKRSNSDTSSGNTAGKAKSGTTTTKKQKQLLSNSGNVAASTSSNVTLDSTRPLEIPLNPNGHPICPFSVNGFTVYSLGEIIWNKPGYHTDEYIYPVGYKISRIYGHFKDPEKKCVYTCRVIENGEFPKFEILANESDPRDPKIFRISGPSPDYCHTTLLQYINNVCVRSIDIRPQGESFFGLGNPTIMSLIRKLPNIEKCPTMQRTGNESNNGPKLSSSSHKLALNSDATLNYDALQRHINLSVYHTVPEIKEEPPEDLFDN